MKKVGLRRSDIAYRLGSSYRSPTIQMGRERIPFKKAESIKKLWVEVEAEVKMGVSQAISNFCTSCGHSHKPVDRQRLITRMVREGLPAREIKEAWSCLYPHKHTNDPSDRRLFRDIAAIKKKEN